MKTMRLAVLALAAVLLVSGCATGMGTMGAGMGRAYVYTHTWQPLTVDMNHTKVVPTSGEGDIKHIGLCVASVAWDSAAFGDIARKKGMNELYFADLETFSILRIWNQYTVHLYGK